MDLNSFIFPAPIEDKSYEINRYKDEILYIPKMKGDKTIYIPCLIQFSKKDPNTNKFLFYYHGNAEDIFYSIGNLDLLRSTLPYHTVAIEYPGYSIYYSEKSSIAIEEDSLIVFDYFIEKIGVLKKDIVIIGRSIGSGPAVYLSSQREVGALILISPFISIQEGSSIILGIFKFLVAERFKNIERIKNVECPVLFIHGQKDSLIPYNHSIELSKNTKGPYEIILPEEMDHNNFNIYDDFLEPIISFLKRNDLILINQNSIQEITFPKDSFKTPNIIEEMKTKKQEDKMTKLIRNFIED